MIRLSCLKNVTIHGNGDRKHTHCSSVVGSIDDAINQFTNHVLLYVRCAILYDLEW